MRGLSRRRKVGYIYPKAEGAFRCSTRRIQIPLLPLHTPKAADRQCLRAPSTSGVGLGAPSGRWSLVSSHPVQQDPYCALRRPPYRVEGVSCSSQGLQAETAKTYRLHRVLHDTQLKTRSASQRLIGVALSGSVGDRSPVACLSLSNHPLSSP